MANHGESLSSMALIRNTLSESSTRIVVLAGLNTLLAMEVETILQRSGKFKVVNEPLEMEKLLALHRPDAVVMSWEPAEVSRLSRLARGYPQTAFVVLAKRLTPAWVRVLATCGAAVALELGAGPDVLIAATYLAASGVRVQTVPHSRAAGGGSPQIAQLTPRELDVAALLRLELNSGQIAEILDVSVETVRSQKTSIYRKLDVHDRSSLAKRLSEWT